MIENVSISNGIAWSPDFKKMYYIDTPTQKVMAYNYNNESGVISQPSVAVEVAMKAEPTMTLILKKLIENL